MNADDRLFVWVARQCLGDAKTYGRTRARLRKAAHEGTARERTAAIMLRVIADHYLGEDGGPGSGNHGHKGRPGHVGGSGGGGGGGGSSGGSSKKREREAGKSEGVENKPKVSKPGVVVKNRRVSSKEFVPRLAAAKAASPPEKAWRVDTSRTPEDFDSDGISTYTVGGGSTFAVKSDGDIVSVCRVPHDTIDGERFTGRDLMASAVARGGTHLDSYSGNYGFYTDCGFEVVSRCRFDERFAPPGWDKTRDDPEDIYFMRYVGVGKVQDADEEAMWKRVPYSTDYDAAGAKLERVLKNGG